MSEQAGSELARATLARLRARIASGEWSVGSQIPTEPELGQLLGVGRSTIREAIRSLATLGMVESLTARGTYVRSATPSPSLLLNALSAYGAAELVSMRRALDVEAAQSAAVQRTEAHLAEIETALREETERARDGARTGAVAHCSRFHRAIAEASGSRLLADLDASLSSTLEASGIAAELAASLDVAICLDQHDRIFVAIRSRDVTSAAHHMAVHADSALRAIHHEPIITDLTTLAEARTPHRGEQNRGIA